MHIGPYITEESDKNKLLKAYKEKYDKVRNELLLSIGKLNEKIAKNYQLNFNSPTLVHIKLLSIVKNLVDKAIKVLS